MKKLLLSISALILAMATQAQITLVNDIDPGGGSSDPCMILGMGGNVYFNAQESVNGRELWSYNTSTHATQLVYNIAPGMTSSQTVNFANNTGNGIVLNDKIYFTANDGTNGAELWMYDGITPPSMVADINPGSASSMPYSYAVLNNKIYFSAIDAVIGRELFVFDPATNTAQSISDIAPGAGNGNAQSTAAFNNKIYFSATNPATGYELYVYDPGTNSSTLLSDIEPGTGDGGPVSLTVINGKLYFIATTTTYGAELYSYSGVGNPTRITDIEPGAGNGVFTTSNNIPTLFNNKIYFCGLTSATGGELYALDITNNTTQMVYEFIPGSMGGTSMVMVNYANALYFTAITDASGSELWKYDGINPPSMVMELNPGANSALPLLTTKIGDKLYFNASDGTTGYELYEYYDAAVGVKKVGLDMNVEVFPVPTTSEAYIRINCPGEISFLTSIYDMAGKIVYAIPYSDHAGGTIDLNIPMQTLAAGNYQYKLTGKDGSMLATGRIVKQ